MVSPTAHHATRFACLFLRSTKVPTNTETVLALWGRPGAPHQGRLNLWLCLVLNTLGLTQPLPSPIDLHCSDFEPFDDTTTYYGEEDCADPFDDEGFSARYFDQE